MRASNKIRFISAVIKGTLVISNRCACQGSGRAGVGVGWGLLRSAPVGEIPPRSRVQMLPPKAFPASHLTALQQAAAWRLSRRSQPFLECCA
jgi:hypothetical protein